MFDFLKKKPKSAESNADLFNYDFVRKSIDDAVTCCNDREGPEFIQGIVCGHMPIAHAVGGNLPYFDALVEYARLTQDDPESRLRVLNKLVMSERATACGLKFLMAQLVLAYGFNNKYPAGESFATNVMRHTGLMEEANALLEAFSKYS